MKDLEYKVATADDLQAMILVGDSLFDNPVKPGIAREFLEDPRHHMILAYKDQGVVGMASGLHYIHPDKDPVLFIGEVGVVDEYQNQGIGRELVKRLCEHGKTFGCKEAWVATEESNLAARKAYVASGGIEDQDKIVLFEYQLT